MPFYYFYPEIDIITQKDKNERPHPWERYIKEVYGGKHKYCHNSIKNPIYPPPKKGKEPCLDRVKFTVIGTSVTKEFIYCSKIVQGLHKYRWKHFDAPVIKGVTSVEWPSIWHGLKIQFGGEAYCLQSQVAVIANDQFVGGEKELKELIETKYVYYIKPDYYVEAVNQFSNFLVSSGRPCASLEIMIDHKEIGPLIFMLYSDLVPYTCENFLRLCKETKGGYAGTPVHRIVEDSWIQCGGYGLKNTDLGCENFIVPHDRRGVIAMCNAGRHVDCSTQFLVLLQPQDWMAHKYVAFGQLISGDHVLKEIEQVKTWYGAPQKKIIIAKASILNLECHDIRINKGTNKYLEAHNENLIEIGKLFYEELLEKVWLEAEFRELQRIQAEMIELAPEQTEFTPEEAAINLRITQRFMRKKEEIDRQILEKSLGTGKTTPAPTVTDKIENNDFDVEEYEYVPEEYSYKQVTPALSGNSSDYVEPEKLYIIPFTDVPYPGEVSSEYDFKRKLQGHYCLESDLEKLDDKAKKKVVMDKIQNHPEKLEELFKTVSSEILSENSLDSDDQREISTYLRDNTDGVSFAGDVIKNLARSGKLVNVFDRMKVSELITDEALRKFRVAQDDFRRENDKVKIVESRSIAMRKEKIRRKQTGFVRPEDLARMRQQSDLQGDDDDEDDEDDEDNYLPYSRQLSVQHPRSITKLKKESIEVSVKSSDDLLEDVIEEEIEEGQKPEQSKFESLRRAHFVRKDVMITVDEDVGGDQGRDSDEDSVVSLGGVRPGVSSEKRASGLTRLFDDVATYDPGTGPTLKNYVPLSEQQRKTSLCLITFSADKRVDLGGSSLISREMYLKRRYSVDRTDFKPIDKVLLLQHGQKVYRKMSTDYVRTIDHIEQKEEATLRSLEYAKFRPAISVADYQKKNKEHREKIELEKLTQATKPSKHRVAKKTKKR